MCYINEMPLDVQGEGDEKSSLGEEKCEEDFSRFRLTIMIHLLVFERKVRTAEGYPQC